MTKRPESEGNMSEMSTVTIDEGTAMAGAAGIEPEVREELDRLEEEVRARVLHAAIDEEARPVALPFRGRVILARPLDTRRFIVAMAPYLCMN